LIQRVGLNLKMHHGSNHQSPLSGSVLVATKSRNEFTTETQRTQRFFKSADYTDYADYNFRRILPWGESIW
jgi:hypothetical protein